ELATRWYTMVNGEDGDGFWNGQAQVSYGKLAHARWKRSETVGRYKVSVYFGHFYRGSNKIARYTLYHKDGSSQFDINQENSANYNRWIELGTFEFDGYFRLDIESVVEPIIADAVKLEPFSTVGGSLARNLPEPTDLANAFEENICEAFALSDAYPNPFNHDSQLKISLKEPAQVFASVYNLMGQQISTIADEQMMSGYHYLRWAGVDDYGRTVSSGVYILRAVIRSSSGEHKSFIRRMVFMK
ncbi:MAG TPA: T9SS type A sorting domain-containing protein, partial [bacterium]|nr:T9SS type A sorting domain-containing protein [bacterium]